MPSFDRIRRLVAGTLPARDRGRPLTDEERRAAVRRAVLDTAARTEPPPPLDRLDPEERASYLPD